MYLSSHLTDEATEETGRILTHPHSHPKSRVTATTLLFHLLSNPPTYFLPQDVPGYYTVTCPYLQGWVPDDLNPKAYRSPQDRTIHISLPKTPTQP